ncbi:hypothetical protein [Dactylosporangium sp. NPDC051541]|uniref:hypothetical protein n=1 Tax=Dactylosporangium sp. NPDC051541 TaxID=3363977 RepID=UPI0037ACE4D8
MTDTDRRDRRLLFAGSAGIAAVAVIVAALLRAGGTPPVSAAPAAGSGAPPVAGTASAAAAAAGAGGCAVVPLAADLGEARAAGASIVLAHGTLTGRTVPEPRVRAEMALGGVETLAGPVVADGAKVWVPTARGPAGPLPGADAGSLWGPDGALFGIVWPQRLTHDPTGPTLRVAPVVGEQVIFSAAGCWSGGGHPFAGPLAEVPESGDYARAARTGFDPVPLDTVRRAARG